MIKEKLVEVLIKSAMNFEDETHRFYVRCRERETNERVSELFERLAEEEVRHRSRLEALLTSDMEDVLKAEDSTVPDIIDLPEEVSTGVPEDEDKALEVLKMALEHEISSHNFYILLSRRSVLSVLKRTFLYLASEEERHIERIRLLLAELEE